MDTIEDESKSKDRLNVPRQRSRRLDRLIFIPIFFSLIAIWAGLIRITLLERDSSLERVENDLNMTVAMLADFNELASKIPDTASTEMYTERSALIWRALLRYPTLSIWIEKNGVLTAGQPIKGDISAYIVIKIIKKDFSVYAALEKDQVLMGWRHLTWERCGLLTLFSLAFIIMTYFLTLALKNRAIAEENIRLSHLQLEEHDALLNAVTKSAAALLGTESYEQAIKTVLALMGKTVEVSWIYLNSIVNLENSHFKSNLFFEWNAPNLPKIINMPLFQDQALLAYLKKITELTALNEVSILYLDEMEPPLREKFSKIKMLSFLLIPVKIEKTLWGCLLFIDSSDVKRKWSWAETDTLKTLAGLIGIAITHMRYIGELANANRQAGMAEIATSVLHNVGNVLNSANVSANLILANLENAKLSSLESSIALIQEHKDNLGSFFTDDPQGKLLLTYLAKLYEHIKSNHEKNTIEVSSLLKTLNHLNEVVATQQTYAKTTLLTQTVDIKNLVEECLHMCGDCLKQAGIEIINEFEDIPLVVIDKHEVMQILVNLITNAKDACQETILSKQKKRVTLRVFITGDTLNIAVADNGVGISQEYLIKIFAQGFTKKVNGHGFGLHNSALSAKKMGGNITVKSEGLGKGTLFTLELPLVLAKKSSHDW